MKRILKSGLSFFLAITIIFSSAYVGLSEVDFREIFAVDAKAASESDLTFELNSDGESYSVTCCDTSAEGELVIPDTYNGLPVTNIGNSAFSSCTSLISITIPNSVTSFDDFAFISCGISSIVIPDSVSYISFGAFEECTNLTSIIIPDSVISIGDSAFGHCTNLTSIIISDSVTSIGQGAFESCSNLKAITIPDSVINIADRAFQNCTSLISINVGEKNTNYSTVEGILFNKDKTILIKYPEGKTDSEYIFPDSVISIGNYAFFNCDSFISITIPDTVTNIGNGAFGGCSNLKSIIIPDSVTSIESGVFLSCTNLLFISLPDSITSIGTEAFCGCTNLTSITIPNRVTKIQNHAFFECTRLTSVTIPDSVTSIGNSAFFGCCTLEFVFYTGFKGDWANITIGDYNSPILNASIHYNTTDHIYEDKIDSEVTCTNNGSKHKECNVCDYSLDDEVIPALGHNYSSEWTIDIEPTCTEEGSKSHHCSRCDNKSDITVIPATVHNYVDGICSGCEKTEFLYLNLNEDGKSYYVSGCDKGVNGEISIPKTYKGKPVTSIGFKAFYDCTGLTSIIIPDTVTNIEGWAFFNTGIYNNSENWDNDVLYVGNHLIKAKKSLSGAYSIKEGTVSIAGCAFDSETLFTSITIPNSIKNIGESAFECCSYLKYVFYTGTRYEWENIKKGKYNTFDVSTVFHYESSGHTSTAWITDKKATVNTAGKKHKECTECGEILETAEIPQLKCSKPKLKTISNTEYGVKITWSKVSGADTYRVYRKTSKSDWKYLGSTSKTGYTDKTAKSGTKYYYAVRARNEAGNSSLSSSLSKLYLADPTLKTPSSTKSGISLKWTKTAGAQGYIIYRKTGSGSYTKLKAEKGVSNLSYVDKSAKKGKKYTYKVKAYYSKTYSAYSNTKTITDKY